LEEDNRYLETDACNYEFSQRRFGTSRTNKAITGIINRFFNDVKNLSDRFCN